MADIGDIPEKTATAVNKPESGTYGEKADLQRLRSQLPSSGSSAPMPQARQLPPISDRPVRPMPVPSRQSTVPGLPDVLVGPSNREWEPVTTMPLGTPRQLTMTAQQMRLMKLDALANSPEVSPETREWARMLKRVLETGGE